MLESSGNLWSITLLADLSASSGVATDFINDSGGKSHVWSPTAAYDSYPSELNFFFGVTVALIVNGNPDQFTLYLGQGHTDDPFPENNWWIGASGLLTASVGAAATLAVNGGELEFQENGSDHSFSIGLDAGTSRSIPEPATATILPAGLVAAFGVRRTRRGQAA